MDLLKTNINKLYFKYLFSAFGSAIICSIYSTVDMVCVGQSVGANGTAALSCVMPLWSIIISIGILFGIGGAVAMGVARGRGDRIHADMCFTVTLFAGVIVTALLTAALALWIEPLIGFFGADETILPFAVDYAKCIVAATPAFLMGQLLIAFIRNDGAPGLALLSVVLGGVVNIVLDIYFVFGLGLGMYGAGLATAIGQYVGIAILLTHFFSKKNKLRIKRPDEPIQKLGHILSIGFSPFIVDLSFGIIVILFNNQIMHYAGGNELAVYGTLSNLHILIQALFYGVGQAVQPIASVNYGASNMERVKAVLKCAVITACFMGVLFTVLLLALPEQILRMYMDTTDVIIAIGPAILRKYALTFLFMGIGIVSSYYFQSVMQTGKSLLISLMRGVILSSVFVYVLPAIFGFDAIWWTMPLTELLTTVVAVVLLRKSVHSLKQKVFSERKDLKEDLS